MSLRLTLVFLFAFWFTTGGFSDDAIPEGKPATTYQEDFEQPDILKSWQTQGDVRITSDSAFKGTHSLLIARTEEDVLKPATATGPSFPVSAGSWMISAAAAVDAHATDSSYNGEVLLDWLGASGNVISFTRIAEPYGKQNWQAFRMQITAPAGAVAARFRVQLNKTYGRFQVDTLAAEPVAPAAKPANIVERVLFDSAALGNLFLPGDKPAFTVTVITAKPLPADQRELTYVVRDYWGVEFTKPVTVTLSEGESTKENKFASKTAIDLHGAHFETGKYYELHIQLGQTHENTAFAFLPEAETKKYKPLEIPFTSRNWDNRIADYIKLSDRLGIRIVGLKGGWKAAPPYAVAMPQIELAQKLNLGALSGTPIAQIEHHRGDWTNYTETALREGAKNMAREYKDRGLVVINLGNEPPESLAAAQENVKAYKAVYEAIKEVAPNIIVVGTAVPPVETYFQAGYQNYLDVFDFHTYSDPSTIRRTFANYAAMFEKYKCRKPVWSTEIGLNSQGMTRQAIAQDLIKKFAIFFACGGQNMSWFTIMYPDRDGKLHGTSGDSFNVFDARYLKYSPRLDGIAYYNMVNAICVKKFAAEKNYPTDVHAILFRDAQNRCLQVLWKDKGRQDALVPLPAVNAVKVIRLDGSGAEFNAAGKGVTLSLAEDPLLLLYESAKAALPDKLGEPAATLTTEIRPLVKGAALPLAFRGEVTVTAPPFWSYRDGQLTAPETTAAREGRVIARLNDNSGELYFPVPLTGLLEGKLVAAPGNTVKLVVRNNAREKQSISARLAILGQYSMAKGSFNLGTAEPSKAFFTDVAETTIEVPGGGEKDFRVALNGVEPSTLYKVGATISDASGRTVTRQRFFSGFGVVPRGNDWSKSPVLKFDSLAQFWSKGQHEWRGPADLSGELRLTWDDQFLHIRVSVTDNVFRNVKQDSEIWAGDGLQFLIDPYRDSTEKPGKYEYAVAQGVKGSQAWCYSSADVATTPAGEIKDFAMKIDDGKTYEIAIPWARLKPFKPAVGANLGFAMIINDDDGNGRDAFMGWFAGVHLKEVDMVGDLILGE